MNLWRMNLWLAEPAIADQLGLNLALKSSGERKFGIQVHLKSQYPTCPQSPIRFYANFT